MTALAPFRPWRSGAMPEERKRVADAVSRLRSAAFKPDEEEREDVAA
jgi:hypothetical protein